MIKYAVILSLALAGSAQAAGKAADYGVAVSSGTPDKRIVITPTTRSVNVTDGQTVEFVIGERSYLWNFQTYSNVNSLPLQDIIPSAPAVQVYVSRNPLYKQGY